MNPDRPSPATEPDASEPSPRPGRGDTEPSPRPGRGGTEPSPRPGRADLHIHTLASDGVASVEEILDHAVAAGLDVIAIADHERIDASVAAQRIAEARGLPIGVIAGEEISTRGGHLVGLFLTERIRPWQSLRASVARVHDQGGIAIVAHPLVPYPLCASARSIRRLLDDPDPIYHPDAIEAFNPTTARMPWSRRVPAFIEEVGVAPVAASDAHRADAVGQAVTLFEGRTIDDLVAAIRNGTTTWDGAAYTWRGQVGMFRRQLGKYARGFRDDLRGTLLRDGTGRDLGYPGGRLRPPRVGPGPDAADHGEET
jgi:predicted metal-dependent phosphoesterase TrpH